MLNPVSKEEFENWLSDPVTKQLRYTLAQAVEVTKEELSVVNSDQTISDVKYTQGWINATMQVLTWAPDMYDNEEIENGLD